MKPVRLGVIMPAFVTRPGSIPHKTNLFHAHSSEAAGPFTLRVLGRHDQPRHAPVTFYNADLVGLAGSPRMCCDADHTGSSCCRVLLVRLW